MEQYFRIIFWTFFLLTFSEQLQGTPIPPFPNLRIQYLDKVLCGENVTFTSPANVQEQCRAAALTLFREGLERANSSCVDETERILDTLESLNMFFPPVNQTVPAECKWENKGFQKPFAGFVEDFDSFIQRFNSLAAVKS